MNGDPSSTFPQIFLRPNHFDIAFFSNFALNSLELDRQRTRIAGANLHGSQLVPTVQMLLACSNVYLCSPNIRFKAARAVAEWSELPAGWGPNHFLVVDKPHDLGHR